MADCAPDDPLDACLRLGPLRARLHALGANRAHVHRIVRLWSHALPQDHGKRRLEDFMPRRVRAALPQLCAQLSRLARLAARDLAADGSQRLLIELHDAQTVEAVLLPRGGLCVSTQVGCAVGCLFCKTGQDGLARQLSSAEIVAQVALARAVRAVTKVVFMGMGEPAHNLEQVLEAIDVLGDEGGVAHKRLVLSTVGDTRVFDRLAQCRVKPALALSLHTSRLALRRRLLPNAPPIEPAVLVERCEAYARASGHPTQYQWTVLAGVNDGEDEFTGIVALLHGKFAVLNLIPYNTVDAAPFQRAPAAHVDALARRLRALGILTTVRRSAGQDIDAGCGQLRARSLPAPLQAPIRLHGRVARANAPSAA